MCAVLSALSAGVSARECVCVCACDVYERACVTKNVREHCCLCVHTF